MNGCLTVLACLSLVLAVARAGPPTVKPVSLVAPMALSARVDYCNSNSSEGSQVCTITFWTRAAEYRIVDFDRSKPSESNVTFLRWRDWSRPAFIKDETEYFIEQGERRAFVDQRRLVNAYAKAHMTSANYSITSDWSCNQWSQGSAYAKFSIKDSLFNVFIRDQAIYICEAKFDDTRQCRPIGIWLVDTAYHVKITAAAAYSFGKRTDSSPTANVDLWLFDATGQVFLSTLEVLSNATGPSRENIKKGPLKHMFNLGALPISYSEDRSLRSRPPNWMRELSSVMPDRFQAKLPLIQQRMEYSFVESITPVMAGPGQSPQDPFDLPLCFSQGHVMLRNPKSLPLKCVSHGKPVLGTALNIEPSSHNNNYALFASHIWSEQNTVYYHFVFDIVASAKDFDKFNNYGYNFCKHENHSISFDNTPSEPIKFPTLEADKSAVCRYAPLSILPNDIIGVSNGVCTKTVALYDSLYTLHEPSQMITEPSVPKEADWFRAKIDAAYAVGTKVFMFTYMSTVIAMDVEFQEGCSKLHFKGKTIIENLGYRFLRHLDLAPNETREELPFVYDYQEYEHGASDTRPALLTAEQDPFPENSRGVLSNVTWPPFPERTLPPSSSLGRLASRPVAIAVALILCLIILAAIFYLCCFREPESRAPPLGDVLVEPVESPPKQGAKSAPTVSTLAQHRTVRSSHHGSAIGSTTPVLVGPAEVNPKTGLVDVGPVQPAVAPAPVPAGAPPALAVKTSASKKSASPRKSSPKRKPRSKSKTPPNLEVRSKTGSQAALKTGAPQARVRSRSRNHQQAAKQGAKQDATPQSPKSSKSVKSAGSRASSGAAKSAKSAKSAAKSPKKSAMGRSPKRK